MVALHFSKLSLGLLTLGMEAILDNKQCDILPLGGNVYTFCVYDLKVEIHLVIFMKFTSRALIYNHLSFFIFTTF